MIFGNSTRFRHGRMVTVAAGVFTALALTSAVPARTQAPSPPTATEAWEMMGADNEVSPRLHGYLLDNGKFTIIDAPGAILGTGAVGINNRGQIVGATILAVNPTIALGFLLAKGDFTTVQFPGALSTEAVGINNRGQIVGTYVDSSNTAHGFLLDQGVFTTIDVPDAFATSAIKINARGHIVGAYSDVSNARPITPLRGYPLKNDVFTRIDVPGASETLPQGMNDRGQIVGAYADMSGNIHGFLLDQSVFTTIDHPDAAPRGAPDFASGATLGTAAFGINNHGQIVGQYGDASGSIHAFLLADGVFTPIEAPGAINTNASDINERGQVVGFYLGTSAGQ